MGIEFIDIPSQPEPRVPDAAAEAISPDYLESDLQALALQERQTDLQRKINEQAISLREREADLQRKINELQVEEVMLDQRKRYAARLFVLSVFWLLAIGTFLFLAGAGMLRVADSVLIALITTTTANVLGLFYIVARWLFPNRYSQDSSPNKDS